jgi:hypothetical protein
MAAPVPNVDQDLKNNMLKDSIRYEYLKLAITLVIVVIMVFLALKYMRGQPATQEGFSPYASILLNDTLRDDPDFDFQNNMPYKTINYFDYDNKEFLNNNARMSSEDKLFNQSHSLVL